VKGKSLLAVPIAVVTYKLGCRVGRLAEGSTILVQDEERMAKLEEDLKHARTKADNADKQYDEVSKKLQIIESELERAEERCEMGETKIMELEEELKVVANNLKSLEVSEEKANQREIANKEQVKTLTAKLKQAEARAEFAERSVQKLQNEVTGIRNYGCQCTMNIFPPIPPRWTGWRTS
jgi:chromosome segregation ATPase